MPSSLNLFAGVGAHCAPSLRRRSYMLLVAQAYGCPQWHTCAGRCMLFVVQAYGCPQWHTWLACMVVLSGIHGWHTWLYPEWHTCAGRCMLFVVQAYGCPQWHTWLAYMVVLSGIHGWHTWLSRVAYMRRPIYKGGCFLSPAVSCCHRGSACACLHQHTYGGRTATPLPVRPTPRSRPHCDELPNRGQGEYRVVTHLNPERGWSQCGPFGLPTAGVRGC